MTILIVEDDPAHMGLVKTTFAREFPEARIDVQCLGLGARNYLRGGWAAHEENDDSYPFPTLIVLDLWLADAKAFGLLEWMARRDWLAKIPVIMITASKYSEEDILRADALGVRRYLCKPDDYDGNLVEAVRKELRPFAEPTRDSIGA